MYEEKREVEISRCRGAATSNAGGAALFIYWQHAKYAATTLSIHSVLRLLLDKASPSVINSLLSQFTPHDILIISNSFDNFTSSLRQSALFAPPHQASPRQRFVAKLKNGCDTCMVFIFSPS